MKSFLTLPSISVFLVSFILTTLLMQSQVQARASCDITLTSGESISDALGSIEEGQVICLEPGTYSGGFNVSVSDITIRAADEENKPVLSGGTNGINISSSANDNILSGLILEGYSQRGIIVRGSGHTLVSNEFNESTLDIELNRAEDITLRDNILRGGVGFNTSNVTLTTQIFTHEMSGNVFADGSVLFYATDTDSPDIPRNAGQVIINNSTNVEVRSLPFGNVSVPIQVSFSQGAIIDDNQIGNLINNPLSLLASGSISVWNSEGAVISNNVIQNSTGRALFLQGSDGAEVSSNQLSDNHEGLAVRSSNGVSVEANLIETTSNSQFNNGNAIYVSSSENLQIIDNDLLNNEGYGIYDANGTNSEHAVIRGNTISGNGDDGIRWSRPRYALIEENTVTENQSTGIHSSPESIVRNNTITDNQGYGLRTGNRNTVEGNEIHRNSSGIETTFGTEIRNNTITDHPYSGIYFGNVSDDLVIEENQFSGNSVDISFNSTKEVMLRNNEMETGVVLHSFYGSFDEYDHVMEGNTVGGKPLVYLKGETNPVIPAEPGQVIAFNSSGVVIENVTLNNVPVGIQLLYSPESEVNNVTITGSGQTLAHQKGLIEVVYSEGSVLDNNNLSNGKRGIEVRFSESVTVSDNTIGHTEDISQFIGIYTRNSPAAKLAGNTISTAGGSRGVEIDGSGHHSEITGNRISSTAGDALTVSISDSVTIKENILEYGAGRGIYMSRALDALLVENTIRGFDSHGIDSNFGSNQSHRPHLDNNTIADNQGTGIRLLVDGVVMTENRIEENQTGAELQGPLTLTHNQFLNNLSEGVLISGDGDESEIEQNHFDGNGSGLDFTGSGVLPAMNNWWGDGSGPSGGSTDPETGETASGSGDSVSDNVRFDPWLTSEPGDDEPEPGETTFAFSNLSVSSNTLVTGNLVLISAVAENTGDEPGEYEATLTVNSDSIETKTGLVEYMGSEVVTFYYQPNEPGEYEVTIEGLESETVVVTEGWTQFNFGVNNNPAADYFIGPQTEEVRVKWDGVTTASAGSSPSLYDGSLYFGTLDGFIHAVDAETGDVEWSFETGNNVRATPVLQDSLLFAGDQGGNFYSLNRHSGSVKWQKSLGTAIWRSATVVDDVVYIGSHRENSEGTVYALEAETGNEIWSFDFEGGISSVPAVVDGVVYIGSNDQNLYALDTAEGLINEEDRVLWSFNTGGAVAVNPTVVDGWVYFSRGKALYKLDAKTGSSEFFWQLDAFLYSNVTVHDGVIYVGTGNTDGVLYALDAETHQTLWSYEPERSFGNISFSGSGPVIAGDIVYIGTTGNVADNRRFIGIDIHTRELVTERRRLGNVNHNPVVHDGVAYISSQSAGIIALRETIPEDFIADAELSEVSATSPHWADGTEQARVDLTVLNEFGDPIGGLEDADFQISAGNAVLEGSVTEQFSEGTYRFYLTNHVAETVNVEIDVNGVTLNDQPEIEFMEADSHWSAVAIADSISFFDIPSVHFVNENTGYVLASFFGDGFGDETIVYKTEDGGESWSDVFSSNEFAMSDLFFADEDHGWVVGSNRAIFHTSDGGETWSEQIVDDADGWVFYETVFFQDQETGWVAGNRNLYKTEDGGESWEQIRIREESQITDIFFIDEQRGWASMFNSQLRDPGMLRTVDGGETWEVGLDSIRTNSVRFIDENNGFAVGQNGLIVKSQDGGETWQQLEPATEWTLNALAFPHADSIWAAGARTTMLFSDDAGDSWEREYAGTSSTVEIQDLHFINSELGWASGRSGTLLKYDATETEPELPDPVVSADSSSVIATTPHLADGSDASVVTITIADSTGNPLDRYTTEDLDVVVSGDAVAGDVTSSGETGEFTLSVTNQSVETVVVTVTVDGTELSDQPEIIFEEPEAPLPVVSADSSSVSATSPHLADGLDISEVTISIADSTGEPISRFTAEDIEIELIGEATAGDLQAGDEAWIFTFGVTSETADTVTVVVKADGVELSDRPQIRFEQPRALVDADSSSVTATSPHIADGRDASLITITAADSLGQPIGDISIEDIGLAIEGEASLGDLRAGEGTGVFETTLTSRQPGTVSVIVTIEDVELADRPEIHFEEPEDPLPIADADSSTVRATSPHLADGFDPSTVSIVVADSTGQPIDHYSPSDLSAEVTGSAVLGDITAEEEEGHFSLTITNRLPETVTVTITVDGIELSDRPVIEFEEQVPTAPVLTSIRADGDHAVLEWEMESEGNVAAYHIYRGTRMYNLELLDKADAGSDTYIDSNTEPGTAYYAVAAVNSSDEESDLSNRISFVVTEIVADKMWALSSTPLTNGSQEFELATLYSFSDRYELQSRLEPGKGYWIKTRSFDREAVQAAGAGLDSIGVELDQGWNLIGSVSGEVPAGSIQDPDGILTETPLFVYEDGEYRESSTVQPGMGHWVYANDSGTISITVSNTPPEASGLIAESRDDHADAPVTALTFTSGEQESQIFVTPETLDHTDQARYYLPPRSPEPILDVRTREDTRLVNNRSTELVLHSDRYPVRISLDDSDELAGYAYRIHAEKEGRTRTIDLLPGQSNAIDQEYDFLRIEMIFAEEMVSENKLHANYPNPFNPTTTIHYQLKEQTHVLIEVFDVIGRRVQTLANETQYSGQHRVDFDGRNLASGMYIIRFHAGDRVDIQKMTLIK